MNTKTSVTTNILLNLTPLWACRILPTIFPLPSGGVDDTEQLIVADRLWVEDVRDGLFAKVLERSLQRAPYTGLARTSGAQ